MRIKKNSVCFMLLVLVSTFVLSGQAGPPAGNFEMAAEKNQVILPFEMDKNHIMITGIINGIKVKLMLDTGFLGHGIYLFENEKIKKSGIKPTTQIMVQGAGGAKPAGLIMDGKVTFDGFKLTNQYIILASKNKEMKKRVSFDGIIGYSIFSRFVVDINFSSKKLILTRPEKFIYSGKGKRLPLIIKNGVFVECSVAIKPGTFEKMNCIIDTGANGTLMIFTDNQRMMPEDIKSFSNKAEGASDSFKYHIFRAHQLKFAGFSFEKPILNFADKKTFGPATRGSDANLGMRILKRFNLIFDYSRKELILEPNDNFNLLFEYNLSGIFFYKNSDKKIIIDKILKGSPAEKAGILVGDIILLINGKKTENLSKDQIRDFWKKNKMKVNIEIKRRNKNKKFFFITKRLL